MLEAEWSARLAAGEAVAGNLRADLVRTTVTLGDDVLERAASLSGVREPGMLLRQALQVLVECDSAHRLAERSAAANLP